MTLRILLLFFLSGATSLVYEVVWMRRLSLVFGHSIFSVSTVLTTFMTGLALGSYLGGRWSDTQRKLGRNPAEFLRDYGRLEFFIGAWAVLSLLLLNGVEAGYLFFARSGYAGSALTAVLFLCSFIVLLPPTVAMGATLPIFTQVLISSRGETGTLLSKIYGLNTLGACFGAGISGLVGLPTIGLKATTALTALLNGLIAVIAYSLARSVEETSSSVRAPLDSSSEQKEPLLGEHQKTGASPLVPLVFGLSGFAGMVYQLSWTRALVLSIGSSTYSFSIILTSFLASLGLGSFLYRKLFSNREPSIRDLSLLQLTIALSALIVTGGMGLLPKFKLATLPYLKHSFALVVSTDALTVFLMLLVPTLALGLTFPLVTHLYTSRLEELGRRLGEAYAANTVGAILGSFLGGFLLIPAVGLERSIALAAVLNLLGGFLLLGSGLSGSLSRKRPELALAVAVLAVLIFRPSWNLALMTAGSSVTYHTPGLRQHPIFYRDGVSSTITVGLNSGILPYLAVNGKTDASIGGPDQGPQLLLGLLPTALHAAPKSTAVIGFGSGQTNAAILAFSTVEKLTCAELEPAVLEAKKYFAPFSEGALDDPRMQLIEDDGRSFILGSPEKFDLIISQPSNPWLAGIGNLYTREFYQGCLNQLRPGGIMGQWFHTYAASDADVRMTLRTFFSVFPEGAVYQVGSFDILLVGGLTAPELTEARIREVAQSETKAATLLTTIFPRPEMALGCFLATRAEVMESLSPYESEPLNTDDLPLLEYRAPISLYDGSSNEGFITVFSELLPPSARGKTDLVEAAILGRWALGLRTDQSRAKELLAEAQPADNSAARTVTLGVLDKTPLDFREVLKSTRPEDKGWMALLGIKWLVGEKKTEGLWQMYEQAAASAPEYARTALTLGAAREAARLGNLELARDLYATAVKLTSEDRPLLETVLLAPEDPAKDMQHLRDALLRNPYNSLTMYVLARYLLAEGRLEEARHYAEESYRLFPVRIEILPLLEEIYVKSGDQAKLKWLKKQAPSSL